MPRAGRSWGSGDPWCTGKAGGWINTFLPASWVTAWLWLVLGRCSVGGCGQREACGQQKRHVMLCGPCKQHLMVHSGSVLGWRDQAGLCGCPILSIISETISCPVLVPSISATVAALHSPVSQLRPWDMCWGGVCGSRGG